MTVQEQIEMCKKAINQYEYISFDIFDTLIKRNLPKPSDLFLIVEKRIEDEFKVKLKNWKQIRINAELQARSKTDFEEITLEEIYENIEVTNEIDIENLKEIEVETELEICEKNMQLYEVYKYCKDNNKKIIITTDMYLPKKVIEKILQKNNYSYNYLFLSSELKKTKHSGELYKYILKTLNIKKEQILHIGDNKNSDYKIARKMGINAIHIKELKSISYKNTKDVKNEEKFNYECMELFINNHIDSTQNYYWKAGYETFGPLLYGYIKWLNSYFKNNQYNQVYFLSRDGYIMKKAYDIIEKNNNSEYIYASRRALKVPTIWMYKNLKDIIDNIVFTKKKTVNVFLKRLGLEPDKYKDIIAKYNYNITQKIPKDILEKADIEFYKEIENDVYENSKNEYKNLLKYYNSINFTNNVAIVDIGWNGNMQQALENIKKIANWNVNIDGYYVGIIPDSDKQLSLNMNGFLFKKDKEDLYYKTHFFISIFEMIFLAHHGSVKKYTEDSKNVEFYPYEYENTDTNINIQNFQEGALQFIQDYSKSNLNKYIEINENVAIYNLLELGNRPKKTDMKEFGNIQFYDDDYYKIINSKSLLYYIFHLKTFKEDLEESIWKTGFLKSIFKINLPYYEILLKIRGVVKKK